MAERRPRLISPATPVAASRRRTTERVLPADRAVPRYLGTGRYLIVQTIVIVVRSAVKTIPFIPHFDPYTFMFLMFILSLQAADAAPLTRSRRIARTTATGRTRC